MSLHIITFNGKPATLQKLYEVERQAFAGLGLGSAIPRDLSPMILMANSAKACKAAHAHLFGGYTWAERPKGVECVKLNFSVLVEVSGGVAEVTRCPAAVNVEIKDHDDDQG